MVPLPHFSLPTRLCSLQPATSSAQWLYNDSPPIRYARYLVSIGRNVFDCLRKIA